ncbi:hypothetical protein MMC25_003412 [Agyrium rufum]|nr:hypothetical protein [Agyrium rufum]
MEAPFCDFGTLLGKYVSLVALEDFDLWTFSGNLYGSPLARIGPNTLLTDSPEATRQIVAFRSPYVRAPLFDTLRITPDTTNIVAERDPKQHKRLKQMMSTGYTGNNLHHMEDVTDKHIKHWLLRIHESLQTEPRAASTFDIGRRIQYLTVDIITDLMLGNALGYLDSNRDVHDFLEDIKTGNMICQVFATLPELNRLFIAFTRLPYIGQLALPKAKDKRGLGRIIGIIRDTLGVQDHESARDVKSLLRPYSHQDFHKDEVESALIVTLVAGSDTTTTAIQSTLLAIISNASVYHTLQAENDAAIALDSVSRPVRNSEMLHLAYLTACMLEGFRKHPPVAQLRERVVPPQGNTILGYNVPGGTYVGFNAWGLQLNPLFGEDPEAFRPERWLTEDHE